MPLKATEIEHLAKLARLELDVNELEKFPQEISAILDYVKRLQEVKGYEFDDGLKSPISLLRADVVSVRPAVEQEKLIAAAQESEDGLIKTKPVFER